MCARSTPASAGRTSARPRRSGSRTEHPYVGGEDTVPGRSRGSGVGTPPRRRGRESGRGLARRGVRNTPASAGWIRPSSSRTSRTTDHPRVGGEDRSYVVTVRSVPGHPTLMERAHRSRTGFRRDPEHPCVGGEDRPRAQRLRSWHGSPPRRRGGDHLRGTGDSESRNTSTLERWTGRLASDENVQACGRRASPSGSSHCVMSRHHVAMRLSIQ